MQIAKKSVHKLHQAPPRPRRTMTHFLGLPPTCMVRSVVVEFDGCVSRRGPSSARPIAQNRRCYRDVGQPRTHCTISCTCVQLLCRLLCSRGFGLRAGRLVVTPCVCVGVCVRPSSVADLLTNVMTPSQCSSASVVAGELIKSRYAELAAPVQASLHTLVAAAIPSQAAAAAGGDACTVGVVLCRLVLSIPWSKWTIAR